MEHLTLKAATTQVTDQGVFEAVISTETADREHDIVDAGAMVEALKKWNRPVPLSWNHSTKAEDIFGAIEPMTARVDDGEVVVQGQVDLDSKVGQEAWRSFKNRTVGFSFGYMAIASSKREDGGRHITEIDIFEVTATPTPMNNDTRVLQTKAVLEELVPDYEIEGLVSDELKAVWSAAYINDLPDSSFLYVESGGSKDADGKTTPRSLRHFPVKGPDGTVDLPHLRNALARIPQSNLPQEVKDRLIKKAQTMLDAAKSVPATDDIPDDDPAIGKSHMQGPPPNHDEHRRLYELATAGIVPAPPVKAEEPPEIPSEGQLRREFYDLMLETVIGEETPE